MRTCIIVMKSDPSSVVVFQNSWKTTGQQMIMYHSELIILRCSSGIIVSCPGFSKMQATIRLDVLRPLTTRSRNFGSDFFGS